MNEQLKKLADEKAAELIELVIKEEDKLIINVLKKYGITLPLKVLREHNLIRRKEVHVITQDKTDKLYSAAELYFKFYAIELFLFIEVITFSPFGEGLIAVDMEVFEDKAMSKKIKTEEINLN